MLITLMSGIVFMILSLIVGDLWDQITPMLFFQKIPTNPQANLGILFFAVAIISGIILILFLFRITKKKPIDTPPTGTQYEQIACPKCGHPNFVYPPTKDYTRVVFSKCKDKGALRENHNVKRQTKCSNCQKQFNFYWCRGHPFVVSKR